MSSIVVFTSLRADMDDISINEFGKTIKKLNATPLYLRDDSNSWYLNGITGLDNQFTSMAVLAGLIDGERTVFIGHSMGGFGAMFYGAAIPATAVIAFSPQVMIDRDVDGRYGRYWKDLHNTALPEMIEASPAHFIVVYGKSHYDEKHMGYLKGLSNVTAIRYGTSHNTAAGLKQDGKLVPLIKDVLNGDYAPRIKE